MFILVYILKPYLRYAPKLFLIIFMCARVYFPFSQELLFRVSFFCFRHLVLDVILYFVLLFGQL